MRKEVSVLLMASIVANFGFGLFSPLYAIFVEHIGGDILSASGAWAIYTFFTGAIIIILGRLEDHKLNKRLMVFSGYFILAIGSLGYFFVETPIHLFVVQMIAGIGIAVIEPAWDGLFSIYLDRGRESFEWSLWSGGTRIALAVAALAGGIIVTLYGFRTMFILMFIVNILAAFVSLQIIKK
ncbi:MAG: MFS transporter [Candidatus Aenigmarchaeota archaeon]|nr:MFS transporter [Candidatus Aenigmarchaeota archaeon]